MPKIQTAGTHANRDSKGMRSQRAKVKIPLRQAGVPSYCKHTINRHVYAVVWLNGKERYTVAPTPAQNTTGRPCAGQPVALMRAHA